MQVKEIKPGSKYLETKQNSREKAPMQKRNHEQQHKNMADKKARDHMEE